MRLTELDPRWVGAGGDGIFQADGSPAPSRHGVGLSFDCPCGCGDQCYAPFNNPLDGGPRFNDTNGRAYWERTGETFETLTLTPSILKRTERGGCGWHGFVTLGEVITV